MRPKAWASLAAGVAAIASAVQAAPAPYADSIVSYSAGNLAASLLSYTNTASALGEPARVTPGDWGGPVDPFSPPYLASQLLAVGTNGSLTVQFGSPVVNATDNPYGIDFMVFGSAGFMITNGDYSGGGITEGSLFGHNEGRTRVSVSADNQTYYALDSSLAPIVDGLYPTDGNGSFTRPVNPALKGTDFAAQNLAGLRALYAGSAGGSGYDLDWALDDQGKRVYLNSIQYVRIEVLDGHSEIDGLAAVMAVPEPATWTLLPGGLALMAWRARRNLRKGP